VIRQRGQHFLLVIGFLGVIAAVAPFQAANETRGGDPVQALDLFRHAPTVTAIRSFEKDLETQSLVAQAIRPRMQYLRFRVFGDAGDKALLGRQGWWFYRPDARYLTERCPERSADRTGYQAAVSAIVSFRDQLALRGINLLVIPVPGKPAIYPEMLTRRAAACDPRVHEHTGRLIAELAAAGVETVDLFNVFAARRSGSGPAKDDGLFLARDSHWTNSGARLAASAAARRIRELGWVRSGSVQYNLQPTDVRRQGDVLRMLKCPLIEALFGLETARCEQVVRHDDGRPYRDDPGASILVLGDSFLRIYEQDEPRSAGFIAHLARELGQPLSSIVDDGGASTLVRQELARRVGLLAGKKLVIWEFVERDVRFGIEGWQTVRLPPYDSAKAERPTGTPRGS
jgi:hypothetical protein